MNDTVGWLDGNDVGGPLGELLGVDLTDAAHSCSCGKTRPDAEHRVYQGSGIVLRCPVCGEVALVLAGLAGRRIVHLTGAWRIEIPHHNQK